MGIPKPSIKAWIAFSIATLLSSCGQLIPILTTDTELTLGGNQTWFIQYTMVLPSEAELLVEQNQASLEQLVLDFQSKGVNASWELLQQQPNETNISYRVSISGTSFNSLNQVVFNGEEVVSFDASSNKQVEFHHLPQFSSFMQGQHNTFTLKSAKILSANGEVIDKGKVQWVDPSGEMTAVVSIVADLTWLWITLLGTGGIGFIVAGLGLSGKLPRRQQKAASSADHSIEQPPSPLPAHNKYCPQCGTVNPLTAGFCIKCGTQFPYL